MINNENISWLDEATLEYQIHKLRRVGHKHMTNYELWAEWIRRD